MDYVALYSPRLTGDVLKYLHSCTKLRRLRLHIGELNAHSFEPLRELPCLTSLTIGGRTDRQPEDSLLVPDRVLEDVGHIKSLVDLSLLQCQVTDDGLAHLGGLRDLCSLIVNGRQISDAGLAHLSSLKSLASLQLGSSYGGKNRITDAGTVVSVADDATAEPLPR